MSSIEEQILKLAIGNSHDFNERLRSINIHAYFAEEHSEDETVLDHMKIIPLETKRMKKEFELKEECLRKLFSEFVEHIGYSEDNGKLNDIIDDHTQRLEEVRADYDQAVNDTGVYERLSNHRNE